jgi:hypothetical protein
MPKHYRKPVFIRQSKPMIIVPIHRLTNESTDEHNSNEFKSNYSSVPTNVTIYSSVTWNRRIYLVTFIGDMSLMNIPGWRLGRRSDTWADKFVG